MTLLPRPDRSSGYTILLGNLWESDTVDEDLEHWGDGSLSPPPATREGGPAPALTFRGAHAYLQSAGVNLFETRLEATKPTGEQIDA